MLVLRHSERGICNFRKRVPYIKVFQSYQLVPTDKLAFGRVFEEASVIRLLVNRLLLLGYVFVVCHNITQMRPASLVKIEG